MAEVYFYIPAGEANNAAECGLKLSKWHDRETEIEGERKKCISTLLNPKDDMEKFMSADFKCLKIEVQPKYSFVSDGYLYEVGRNFPEVLAMYESSVMPLESYTFGLYRLPVCLITSTVIADQISIIDKRIDSPVLFNSSEELYVNNLIEINREKNDNFNDTLLYYFFCNLAEKGKLVKIEDRDTGMAVFTDREKNSPYTIRIPDAGQPAIDNCYKQSCERKYILADIGRNRWNDERKSIAGA